jgi:hypothetical protein
MFRRDTTVRDELGRFGLVSHGARSGTDELAILGLLGDGKFESDSEVWSNPSMERGLSMSCTRIFGVAGAFAALLVALPGGTSAPGRSQDAPGIQATSTARTCSACECGHCR